jgi:hypothetical protein
LKEERLLLYLDKWYNDTDIDTIKPKEFHIFNRLTGRSKCIVTDKYELMQWFLKKQFPQSLPCIVFFNYDESVVKHFLSRGSKHKFLKASDGFAGTGIKVVDSAEEIKHFIEAYQPTTRFEGWILQDALEDIATFQGYKFHLRVLIIVTVQNGLVSVCIGNLHFYLFSKNQYDKTKLKEEEVYNTHRKKNAKNAFFPIDLPDHWTAADGQTAIRTLRQTFLSIFKQQNKFLPDWNVKNGYELFGADVVFDIHKNVYIIEINQKMGLMESQVVCLPEAFHIGLGGAPMKLFSPLYGTPVGRTTPFTKSLSTFYETTYVPASNVKDSFQTLFHTKLEEDADRAYLVYQSYSHPHRYTRKKHRPR